MYRLYDDISWQIYGNAVYIRKESNEKLYVLEGTSLEIWELLTGQGTFEDIVHFMLKKYDVSSDELVVDLNDVIELLIKKDIIFETNYMKSIEKTKLSK